jgi:hypothetical protein
VYKPARIKPRDVAILTGLSLRQVQQMAAEGKIPGAAKLGGVWSFAPEKVTAWIKNGESQIRAKRFAVRRRTSSTLITDVRNTHEPQRGYLYRRGSVWWGRVKLGKKEHRSSLRTHDHAEAVKRLKVMSARIEREFFGMMQIEIHPNVYFIHDTSGGFVKVGISHNINRRYHALNCNTASDVILLGSIEGSAQLEELLHRFLCPFHHKGEWFMATDVVVDFIKSIIEIDRIRLSGVEPEKTVAAPDMQNEHISSA